MSNWYSSEPFIHKWRFFHKAKLFEAVLSWLGNTAEDTTGLSYTAQAWLYLTCYDVSFMHCFAICQTKFSQSVKS